MNSAFDFLKASGVFSPRHLRRTKGKGPPLRVFHEVERPSLLLHGQDKGRLQADGRKPGCRDMRRWAQTGRGSGYGAGSPSTTAARQRPKPSRSPLTSSGFTKKGLTTRRSSPSSSPRRRLRYTPSRKRRRSCPCCRGSSHLKIMQVEAPTA